MKHLYSPLAALALAAMASSADAAVLYSETFTGQLGKGYTGPEATAVYDISGVTWGFDDPFTPVVEDPGTTGYFTATSDWVRVADVGGGEEAMRFFDPGGPVSWWSPAIDISGFTDFEISIFADTTGGFQDVNGPNDALQFYYTIDAGPEVQWYEATTQPNGITVDSGVIAQTGSTMYIRVLADTRRGDRSIIFDTVTLNAVAIPEPVTATALGLSGLAGLLLLRRRRV